MTIGSGKGPVKKSGLTVYENADYVTLVDLVRKSRDKSKSDAAFNEIAIRMQPKIKQISYKLNIPGSEFTDVYQEALWALRYKAIKDYDPTRGNGSGPYPFHAFAALCIRRHLSTKIKASYQNKKRVWISTISLEQERSDNSDDNLFLVDIIPHTKGNLLEELANNEYARNLFRKLYKELSEFEQEVFMLYIQKHSYETIRDRINHKLPKKQQINVKSVDNAISRLKKKAHEIREKYEDHEAVRERTKKEQTDVKPVDNAIHRIKKKARNIRKKYENQ